jgi:hypothetical protein
MLKIIALLVLSGSLNVAVETDSGWVEKSFPNTARGAEELVGFAENAVGDPPGVRVVLGSLSDKDNQEHISKKFASIDLPFGIALPADVKAAAAKHRLKPESAIAVAKADEEKFGFLYRRKPKK